MIFNFLFNFPCLDTASAVNQEFRDAQFRGTPYPILWIAEYFTIDGEGIRWGRFYRQAGFYAHIMMWLAFCFGIISSWIDFISWTKVFW